MSCPVWYPPRVCHLDCPLWIPLWTVGTPWGYAQIHIRQRGWKGPTNSGAPFIRANGNEAGMPLADVFRQTHSRFYGATSPTVAVRATAVLPRFARQLATESRWKPCAATVLACSHSTLDSHPICKGQEGGPVLTYPCPIRPIPPSRQVGLSWFGITSSGGFCVNGLDNRRPLSRGLQRSFALQLHSTARRGQWDTGLRITRSSKVPLSQPRYAASRCF